MEIEPVNRHTIWRMYSLPQNVRVALTALLPLGGVVSTGGVTYTLEESGSPPKSQAGRPRRG
jgi:hypothetical protein